MTQHQSIFRCIYHCKKIMAFIVFMFASLHCVAQCNLSGIVRLSDGTDVDAANVFVSYKSSPKTILASTLSAEGGSFSLNLKTDNSRDSLILQVSSIEIAPTRMTIPNCSGNYNIIVESRNIQLKRGRCQVKKDIFARRHHKL